MAAAFISNGFETVKKKLSGSADHSNSENQSLQIEYCSCSPELQNPKTTAATMPPVEQKTATLYLNTSQYWMAPVKKPIALAEDKCANCGKLIQKSVEYAKNGRVILVQPPE